jgi:hypothetical protein
MKTWCEPLAVKPGRLRVVWRSFVLGLWLVCGALPLFGQPGDGALPPCCRADGAHKCAMRLRAGKVPSVQAPSCCPVAPESAAAGARLVALNPRPPAMKGREVLTWEVFPLPSEGETVGVAVHRASRAPPRRSI